MFRHEASHAGLGETAHALLELMEQQSDSQGSALVSARSQTFESATDSATGHRLNSEKVPAFTAENTQQPQPRKYSGKTHTASASGSGDPYRRTLASNSSRAEGQFASQSERLASNDARVSGFESKASALGLKPGPSKQFTPREEGAGIPSPAWGTDKINLNSWKCHRGVLRCYPNQHPRSRTGHNSNPFKLPKSSNVTRRCPVSPR